MSDPNEPHYGGRVKSMQLLIECGDHMFQRDGLQEGPCLCPTCGRRFVLTWSVNVEPAPPGYRGLLDDKFTDELESVVERLERLSYRERCALVYQFPPDDETP